jgi:hypothetical protein
MTFSINTLNIKTKRSKPSWDDLIINQFCVSISHQNVSCQDFYGLDSIEEAWTAYHLRAPEFTLSFLVMSVLLISLAFCVVLLCVFTFWVPCWNVRCDFCIKTIFGSSLPPVVCRRVHTLFALVVFVCL